MQNLRNLMPQNKNVLYAIVAVLVAAIIAAVVFLWPGSGSDATDEQSVAADGAKAAEEEAVATVNGKKITVADMALAEEEMAPQLRFVPNITPQDYVQIVMNYLIERELVAQDGRTKNMNSNKNVQRRVDYYTQKAIHDVHLSELAKTRVTEDKARAFYDQEIKNFQPQEQVRARHVLVSSKAEADEALSRVKSGTPFEEVAKQMSKDSGSAQNGGDVGYFIRRGQMIEPFADAAFSLKAGEISQPVQSPMGWHVIRVEERRMQPTPTFEQAKDSIYNELMRREARTVVQELKDKAEVNVLLPGANQAASPSGEAPVAGQVSAPSAAQ